MSRAWTFLKHTLEHVYEHWSTQKVALTVLGFDLIVLSAAVYLETVTDLQFFKEGYPMTWLSVFHLLLVAWTAWKTFERRDPKGCHLHWKTLLTTRLSRSTSVWALIAIGFVVLALDELLMLHELADILIHLIFSIQQTPITDRLDDVLILLYFIPAFAALVYYWKELKQFRGAVLFLLSGLVCAVLMVVSDVITNQNDIVPLFVEGRQASDRVFNLLKLFEESMKVIAEAFFVGALYFCYEKAGTMPESFATETKQAA